MQFETYYHEITSCFVWNTERSFESVIHFITQLLSFYAFANPCENTTTSNIFIATRIILLATELKVTTSYILVSMFSHNLILFHYAYLLKIKDSLNKFLTVQNLLLREFFERDIELFCLSGSKTTIRGITLYWWDTKCVD